MSISGNAYRQAVQSTPKSILPIAVIIPVAGRPLLLRRALHSILAGKALPAEIIVVRNALQKRQDDLDQHSLELFCRRHHDFIRIHQIQIHNLFCSQPGPAAARNLGWQFSSQPYIAMLDSDDAWTPDKLSDQWRYLKKRPHLEACHTAEIWIKSGQRLQQPLRLQSRGGRFLQESLFTCLISASSILLKKNLLHELHGFDESYPVCEDFELWLRLLKNKYVGLVAKPLTIKYAGNWSQLSRSTHSLDLWRIQALLNFLSKNQLEDHLIGALLESCRQKIAILEKGALKYGTSIHLQELKQIFQSANRISMEAFD